MPFVLKKLLPEDDQPREAKLVGPLFRWAMASSMPASATGISDDHVWERTVRTFCCRVMTSRAPATMPTRSARTKVVTNTEPAVFRMRLGSAFIKRVGRRACLEESLFPLKRVIFGTAATERSTPSVPVRIRAFGGSMGAPRPMLDGC